ncbi:MAG: hypothetical protein HYV02_06175 [Deltaproteobacteria bacterium]|nr:hypothetical protein [Deltaproteobacteria bacterium]
MRFVPIIGLLLTVVLSAPAPLLAQKMHLPVLEAKVAACVATLSPQARHIVHQPSQQGRIRLPRRDVAPLRQCLSLARDVDDARAVLALQRDLMALPPAVTAPASEVVQAEAMAIAERIVATTRAYAERYRMVGSPLFNNFLVHVGAKEGGFCYQWTSALARAMQTVPWNAFAHHWGVANLQKVTENNALLIVRRGMPIETGLVYDAWRGAGTPYWRKIAADHYQWTVRYSEHHLSIGVGLEPEPE